MQAQPGSSESLACPHTADAQVTKQIRVLSPRFRARMAGVFEALEGTGSSVGQVFILSGLIVEGSASATAANILANAPLIWLGFAISLLAVVFHLVWAFLFYGLFKPVNRSISLLATYVIVVGCAIQAVTCLLYLAPLLTLQNASILSAFTPQQVQDLSFVFLKLNGQAFDTYLIFFGLWCVLIGYLIFRSTFLPRIIGVLLMIDGLGWMLYLVPPFAQQVFPLIAVAAGLAEIPLMLWLLVVGLNEQRWKEQEAAARASRRK